MTRSRPVLRAVLFAVVITAIVTLAAVDVVGLLWLRGHGGAVRLMRVDDLSAIRPSQLDEGPRGTLTGVYRGDDPVDILRQVMDSVDRTGEAFSTDVTELREAVGRGEGLNCWGMSLTYYHALRDNGFDARIVYLVRHLWDPYDTHTTVEVWEDGRWVVYDPTFNVSFVRDGRALGAQEIKESLVREGAEGIEPLFHGEVAYPARIEDYQMDWRVLFDNIFVPQLDVHWSLAERLPPLRFWYGPRYYHQVTPGHTAGHLALSNDLYYGAVVVIPTVLAVLSLALAALLFEWLLSLRRARV